MSNRDQRKNVRRLKKRLKETKVKKTVQILNKDTRPTSMIVTA